MEGPLFIVDMTLYEFTHILKLINQLDSSNPIKEMKLDLKQQILNMFGKIPIDFGKRPRRLTTAKEKMAGNFMITINQLKMIENVGETTKLFNLYLTNEEFFYNELKSILINKGRWKEIIELIEKINREASFLNKKDFIEKLAEQLHLKYKMYSKKRNLKQLQYIMKWLCHPKLKILGDYSKKNGYEIL